MSGGAQAVGVLFLTAGAWWIYSGLNGFRPVALLNAVIANPDKANETIAAAKSATAVGGFSGGGSFGGGDTAPNVGNSTGSTNVDPSGSGLTGPKAFALSQLASYGWATSEFDALDKLWTQESSWNYKATNPSSGAYGIPQALPASKMASAGSDYMTNANTQIRWGLGYIKGRYGSPSAAWKFHQANNWY